ncbi:MAG: prephenate dehydrogenase [Sedimentisphaeraceae bacterium JB056]
MNLAVIGTGLLGASVSLAAKKHIKDVTVTCYDRSSAVMKKAVSLNICDKIAPTAAECVKDADIVVIASPIFTFKDLYFQIRDSIREDCIVTDTGSTKTMPVRWAQSIFKNKHVFIGSHPIAGSENSGLENASDSMLKNAKCIITLHNDIDDKRLEKLTAFWTKLGCTAVTMTTDEHDKLYGLLSHLPHAAAAALVNSTKGVDLSFAGSGFKDATRIAAGPSDIWEDIFLSNAQNLNDGIDQMISSLNELKSAINDRSRASIADFLDSARKRRKEI